MNELDIIELDFITRISKTMEARGMTATALASLAPLMRPAEMVSNSSS